MARELWVACYPSFYGGADTELDHNIDLWRRFDIDVHSITSLGLLISDMEIGEGIRRSGAEKLIRDWTGFLPLL